MGRAGWRGRSRLHQLLLTIAWNQPRLLITTKVASKYIPVAHMTGSCLLCELFPVIFLGYRSENHQAYLKLAVELIPWGGRCLHAQHKVLMKRNNNPQELKTLVREVFHSFHYPRLLMMVMICQSKRLGLIYSWKIWSVTPGTK